MNGRGGRDRVMERDPDFVEVWVERGSGEQDLDDKERDGRRPE
jgi:hypothetical protein